MKAWLTKSNINETNIAENPTKNMYIMRKAMQPAYRDLFQALLRLPDRQVQARVLDAINDRTDRRKIAVPEEIIQTCDKCKSQKTKMVVDVGTQTTISSTINEEMKANLTVNGNSDDSIDILPTTSSTSTNDDSSKAADQTESVKDEPKKRKHRRKVRAPQVIKKSQAKQLQEQQQQFGQKQKRKAKVLNDETHQTRTEETLSPTSKRQRSDSLSSTVIAQGCLDTMFWDNPWDEQAYVVRMMLEEYRKAEIIQDDGLIPIHSAIMNDDLRGLKRQIYVWRKLKKTDLNELCTEDDEDCLQLAIVQNKSRFIVDELLKNDLDLNSLDLQSNNLIHLAVLNEVDIEIFKSLLERIDLEILLKLNDDGYTALHLTVRQDNFLMTEIMLNTIDKRSFGRSFYNRDSKAGKAGFLSYYEKCCENLEFENSILKESKAKQRIKRRLIDAVDIRSGSTALYYSIENKFEHLIYLLLAHFSDPRVENHSGQSSRSYLGEFAKTLNLSLKIDRVMEQVENILDQ